MIYAVGKRIAVLRRKAGLSQATLAKQLGLSASAIGMYEQGRREPSLDVLVSISLLFGVTTDYLLTGKVQTVQNCATVIDGRWKSFLDLYVALLTENCDNK